jgi:glycosyltransferase involved in cell wall biosynthesis
MRILQVMEATLGGTRRYLEDVSQALGNGSENGLVYSLHRADAAFIKLLDNLRRAGWTLFEVDMRRAIHPIHDAKCAAQLQRIYRQYQPDVVHAHSSKAGALSRLATIGMKKRPRIVYTPHSIASNVSRVYGIIERVLALRLDILTAVTESEREELHVLKLVPLDRIHVVVPTVPYEVFAPRSRDEARRALGFGSEPIIVAVGRLTRQKDPLAFVELAAELRKRVPDLRAVWVGDGELRSAMAERIAALRLETCVSITGWLDDVRPHLAAANLFVSTSRYESFGYVTAEALAMERPVVASEITGTIDVVQRDMPEQLFALDDGDGAAQLAERILRDPELADAIAQRGRAFVTTKFSVEETRRGLHAAYAAALRTGRLAASQVLDGMSKVEAAHVEIAGVTTDAPAQSWVG